MDREYSATFILFATTIRLLRLASKKNHCPLGAESFFFIFSICNFNQEGNGNRYGYFFLFGANLRSNYFLFLQIVSLLCELLFQPKCRIRVTCFICSSSRILSSIFEIVV